MKTLQTIGAIIAMIFNAGSMLSMWVFAAASLANNKSEASYERVKLWVINFSLFSLAGIGVGIWLLLRKRHGWSVGAALLPAFVMLATFIYLVSR